MTRSALLAVLLSIAGCGSTPASPDAAIVPGTDAFVPGVDAFVPGRDAAVVPGTDAGPGASCTPFGSFTGQATYYAATGAGACSFDAVTGGGELLVAAMNLPQWDGSNVCGQCVSIDGPMGNVVVRIVDQCPECPMGNLDLSPEAFAHIAPLPDGRVPITWHEVPCDVTGPIEWRIKEGSNQWWTAVQVRNHRHRIARVERRHDDGSWSAVSRVDYNFFVDETGFGTGPFTLRAVDVYGNVVEDSGITLTEAVDQAGAAQFPVCE